MRSLFYALFLLAILVASVLLLRSTDHRRAPERGRHEPVVWSDAPERVAIDRGGLEGAGVDELFMIGDELLSLWHVREATEVLEQALAADSTRFDTLVRLMECYASPLVSREDAARAVAAQAGRHVSAPGDSLFLAGLSELYIDRDYAAAARTLEDARTGARGRDASTHLAAALLADGRPGPSREITDDLLTEDDSDGRALELSVRCLLAVGDTVEAAGRARDLARQYAEEPFPYVLLAAVELTRGHTDDAVQFCNNALQLDPRYIPAIVCRAALYLDGGALDAAQVSFEKLLLFDDPVLRAIGHDGVACTAFLAGDFPRGVDAMDEAIRSAMLPGAVRRGLSYASQLINYLCEIGEAGAAEEVVDRWVKGFGSIPETLARLRIDVLAGRYEHVRKTLIKAEMEKEWLVWAEALSLDTRELAALAEIGEGRYRESVEHLSGVAPVGAGVASRRAFLRGYALFESGDAESARTAFAGVRSSYYTPDFPYRGDPVLFVQAQFYIAECELAAGHEEAAAGAYRTFLDAWGNSAWDLRAVVRAREKLEGLSTPQPAPSG